MENVPMKKFMIRAMRGLISFLREGWSSSSRFSIYHQAIHFVLITLLSTGSLIVTSAQADAYGANPGPGNVCGWHTVLRGDTLGSIARYHHSNISSLARANHISNINRIFVGQRLCIPSPVSGGARGSGSGLQSNGSIRQFAYNA